MKWHNNKERPYAPNGTALKPFAANLEGAGVFDLQVSAAWMPQSSLHGWIYGVLQIEYTGAQTLKAVPFRAHLHSATLDE